MNVIRYNPWGFVGRFSRDADRFFAHHLLPATAEEAVTHNDWVPAIDVREEEGRYLIRADVPGVEVEDLDVTMDQGVLTLQGKRDTRAAGQDDGLRRSERVSGRFYRRFNLPESADSTDISADYRQGVLEISIPKQPEAQPQRIEIKVN
jgi:HSP20 family protein